MSSAVTPAYLGWGKLRLYATDLDDATAPRWDQRYVGGRAAEYALVERFGQAEGDRFLVVRVGDRFVPDEAIEHLAALVLAVVDRWKAANG